MKKRDITTHSQKDTNREPRVILFIDESERIKFKVHRHIYYPGTWLLTCDGLCEHKDLGTDDLEEAEEIALETVKRFALEKAERLRLFAEEIEDYQYENQSGKGAKE